MRPLAVACALCFGCGTLLAAHLAYAEIVARRDTPEALIRAAALDRFAPPPIYFERLAELDPDHASQWLDAVLQANPRLSSAWIVKGLASERDKAFSEAERDLLQAASIDHQYLPAWTLANFYFRQNRRLEFWLWARRAAALTYDDYRPLLALAHAIEPNPRVVIDSLGGATALVHADLDYLVQHHRLDDAQQVARLLLARQSPADAPRIMALADRQIQAGHAADALELWNAVSPRQLSFTLSNAQPEAYALLEQAVPLDSAHRYRLCFEYLATTQALLWDLDGDAVPIPPAAEWQSGEANFRRRRSATPPNLGKLRLLYRPEPGTARAPGRIELRNLHMQALSPEAL